jgi:predicted acyltransferase
VWAVVCEQQTHVAWTGVALHDLIQPSFYFLVGVAFCLSQVRRMRPASEPSRMTARTLWRAVALVVLGMTLVAAPYRRWQWYFVDTLTQIGLAYPFLAIIGQRERKYWFVAIAIILVAYWSWFAVSPVPGANFDYAAVGVDTEWLKAHGLTGFAAHWQKNSNPAWAFDYWFLNLFPRDVPFVGYDNGLTTLSFIPSLATMVLGLFAGATLTSPTLPMRKTLSLILAGLCLFAVGWLLGLSGISPVVKAIWTPSWVLFSGGLCYLLLATFHWIVDIKGLRRLVFPLTVIGVNSIVAYSLYYLYPAFAFNGIRRVVGDRIFQVLGSAYEPALYGVAIFGMYWLTLYVLYRAKLFIRV